MTAIGPHLLSSPVLSDAGVLALINSPDLHVHHVDTTFAVNVHDLELDLELNRVVDETVDNVLDFDNSKPQMILLCDLKTTAERGPLPMLFVASQARDHRPQAKFSCICFKPSATCTHCMCQR